MWGIFCWGWILTPSPLEAKIEAPGTTALQCVIFFTSVGKRLSKIEIFLMQRSCILWTYHQSGSSDMMYYLVVKIISNKIFHLKEKKKVNFLPKTQTQHIFQKLMPLLLFRSSVVTVKITWKCVPLHASVQPKALANLPILFGSLLYCNTGDLIVVVVPHPQK